MTSEIQERDRPSGETASVEVRRPVRIAHLSDPHVYRLFAWPWQFAGKRLFGWLNLVRKRRHVFRAQAFASALARAYELEVDWIVVTGDLTQTALGTEFRAAARILAAAGTGSSDPDAAVDQRTGGSIPTVVIPGNHDRYTQGAVWTRRFERYLREVGGVQSFPSRIDLSPTARLFALDPNRPSIVANGTLPARQLSWLRAELADAWADGVLPVVASHYPVAIPPGVGDSKSHRLTNRDEMRAAMGAGGPALLLHGHVHRPWVYPDPTYGSLLTIDAGACGFCGPSAPLGSGLLTLTLTPMTDVSSGSSAGLACWGNARVDHHVETSAGHWSVTTLHDEAVRGAPAPA